MTGDGMREVLPASLDDTAAARFLIDLLGYGLVSLVALACDCGTLLLLVRAGTHYLVAATVGFSAGMLVAYVLSVRFVFADRCGAARGPEALGFVLVGIAGLALTELLLYVLVARLGLAVAVAKLCTTGVVFLFNFLGRRSLVFRGNRAA